MSSSNSPYIFDEFFTSGLEESISPFLEKKSKKWARNLSLKSSLIAGFFLVCAYFISYFIVDLSNFFLLLVYFLVGTPALFRTIEDIKNFEINIDVLMTMAAFLSFIIGSQMEGGLLLVLFAVSGSMETSVSKKTKGTLINLHRLSPTTGIVIENETFFQKSVRDISVKDRLLVRAGEVVPLDGVVIDGSSFVNLVHLTGESLPVSKTQGDEIQAGSRNLDGTLTIEVTKTSAESTLSKIIKLINEAQEMKPKLQRFLDKFGKRYATTVISLFFFFSLALPWIFPISYFGIEGSIYRALTFLIAASPCALIIATPTAYLSAINSCARKGILLKGGIILDALSACHTIAFDKTGTLTTGKLTCIGVESIETPHYSIEESLSIASALERHITHPMAEAICKLADQKKLPPATITDFQSVPGFGLKGKVAIKGKTIEVKIGNEAFISPNQPLRKTESMISFLKIDSSLFNFHFEDTLRKGSKKTLETLKERGLEIVMLTGDHQESANKVAKELHIDKVYADLRPENKLNIISRLSSEKYLAMVGDGINDAPALTRAGVGISMGKIGSAAAIDASDIVLLQDDITLISYLHKKAKKTMVIVRENLILALGVIFLATTPALLGSIPLWLAVVLHEGGTVLVGLNSLRLLRK